MTKVWLQFPADKGSPLFGQSSSLLELVQQKYVRASTAAILTCASGTEVDPNYNVNANQGVRASTARCGMR